MKIITNSLTYECKTEKEIAEVIKQCTNNPYDDILIKGRDEYPQMTILVKNKYACVHYFKNASEIHCSIGKGVSGLFFMINGESEEMDNHVISISLAIRCAKEFFADKSKLPSCCEWD